MAEVKKNIVSGSVEDHIQKTPQQMLHSRNHASRKSVLCEHELKKIPMERFIARHGGDTSKVGYDQKEELKALEEIIDGGKHEDIIPKQAANAIHKWYLIESADDNSVKQGRWKVERESARLGLCAALGTDQKKWEEHAKKIRVVLDAQVKKNKEIDEQALDNLISVNEQIKKKVEKKKAKYVDYDDYSRYYQNYGWLGGISTANRINSGNYYNDYFGDDDYYVDDGQFGNDYYYEYNAGLGGFYGSERYGAGRDRYRRHLQNVADTINNQTVTDPISVVLVVLFAFITATICIFGVALYRHQRRKSEKNNEYEMGVIEAENNEENPV